MICENCEKEISDDSKFCISCKNEVVVSDLNEEYKTLGTNRIKTQIKVFKIIDLACFGWFIFLLLIMIFANLSEESNDMVAAIIMTSIIFFSPVVVFLILVIKRMIILKNEEEIIKIGKEIYDDDLKEKQEKLLKEQNKAIKEKEKQDLIDEEIAQQKPDFTITNEFVIEKNSSEIIKVWLNTETKLIQFRIPYKETKNSVFLNKVYTDVVTKMKKTRVYSISEIDDVNMEQNEANYVYEKNDGTRLYNISKKKDVVFKIKDVNCPIIRIEFGDDLNNAESLYEIVSILINNNNHNNRDFR